MSTIKLPILVKNWGQDDYKTVVKQVFLNISQKDLPLYRATEHGGFVVENKINFSIQSVTKKEEQINIKCFVFFYELVVGCGCGDEPFKEPITCEMLCTINIKTALANFTVLPS